MPSSADNLGNHNATTRLNMAGNDILINSGRFIENQDGDQNIQIADDNPTWNGDGYGGVTRFYGDGTLASSKLEAGGLQLERRLQVKGGGAGVDKVLRSDATGNATWVDIKTAGIGDDLGNHIATTGIKRSNHNVGHLEGSYNNVGANSTNTNPIYTIGSAYNPTTTALSNMYGTGYSHSNFWGTAADRPTGWGEYVAADGDIRVILEASSGRIWAAGDIRSNGGYRVDGNVVIDDGAGWHRSYGNTGWYNGTHGGGWYMTDATWVRAYNNKSVWTPQTMQADVRMQSPVFNFGNWNNGAPADIDGQLFRTGGQACIEVDDWLYIRDNDENQRIRLNTDAGRIECGPGAYNGNAISFGGYITSNSTSDGHRVLPLTGNYGYVGTNTQYWWYMHSNNFIDPSSRDKKKDFTQLDGPLYEYVMNDIDKLNPTFYRYKGETKEFVEGNETKYRPNMHLGVILEDAPDYIQDQAFSGIDIYAMGVLSLAGVKYNRNEIQQIKQSYTNKLEHGQGQVVGAETNVLFSAVYSNSLNGKAPIVNVTPTSANTGFYITDITDQGFKVVGNSSFYFNWSATNIYTDNRIDGKRSGCCTKHRRIGRFGRR